MKKIILFVAMAVVAMSIYSCQKDHSVKPKATIGTLSKAKKDTTPPSACKCNIPERYNSTEQIIS
jgi:hypothetical protein